MFLDIEMPVMNGYRCAQYIRSWEQHVQRPDRQKICALSSHDTEDEQQLAHQVGGWLVGWLGGWVPQNWHRVVPP